MLCAAELLLFVLPINLAAYLPHFFFGAVLVFIAIDLLLDWLIRSRHKVSSGEYVIVWATFLAISFVGLQGGMGIGLGISIVQFVLSYARVRKSQPVCKGSKVMRGFDSRRILAREQDTIAVFELTGYIFFGSVVQIVADIESNVRVPAVDEEPEQTEAGYSPPALDEMVREEAQTGGADGGMAPTAYVVVDLQAVNGVDATAARSCFLALLQVLRPHGIPLCLAHVTPMLEKLLRAHDVIRDDQPDCQCFESTSEAVEWCEANILRAQGIVSPQSCDIDLESSMQTPGVNGDSSSSAGLRHVLVQFAEDHADGSAAAPWVDTVSRYFERQQVKAGATVFSAGDPSDCIYVLERGSVTLLTSDRSTDRAAEESHQLKPVPRGRRILRYENGGIFGELDFFLGQPRSFDAVAETDCTMHVLRRDAFARVVAEEPVVGAAMCEAVLRHLCLETHTLMSSLRYEI